jgi:hypothetical protein
MWPIPLTCSPLAFDPQVVAQQQQLQAGTLQASQHAPGLPPQPAQQLTISAPSLPQTGPIPIAVDEDTEMAEVPVAAVVPPIVIHNPKEPVRTVGAAALHVCVAPLFLPLSRTSPACKMAHSPNQGIYWTCDARTR